MIPRRHLLGAAVACAALPAAGLLAAESSYDLVIRGGRVVDPSQRIAVVEPGVVNATLHLVLGVPPRTHPRAHAKQGDTQLRLALETSP